MIRALALPLGLFVAVSAQAQPIPTPAGSQTPVIATGSTTARTLAERASQCDPGGANCAVINVKDYGAKGDGVTDDAAAIRAALTAAVASGGEVVLPSGAFRVASSITATIPSGVSLTIVGQGADVTRLVVDSGINGLALTLSDISSSFHVRDMTIAANGTTTGTIGLSATLATAANPAAAAQNDISNVTLRGADGYAASKFWDTGLLINGVSNVAYSNVTVEGNAGATAAYCAHVVGTASATSVVHNFVGGNYNYCAKGLWADIWTQGITVNQVNFTGDATGIHEPSGTGTTQLTVTNSQFNATAYGIYDHGGVQDTFANNLFIVVNASAIGIDILSSGGTLVGGNTFSGNNSANSFGLQIETGDKTISVANNYFTSLAPYWFSSPGVAYSTRIRDNYYLTNSSAFGAGSSAILDSPQTFAQLTPAAASLEGRTAIVTDSTTATWGATITGAGANHVLAYCDGTNWTVAGK